MVDKRYDLYCFTDRVFYDSPATNFGDPATLPAAGRAVPDGWQQADIGWWRHLSPTGTRIPSQGWKIHVSACPGNADKVLSITWDYCVGRRIAFKFLATRTLVLVQNSKYASRTASGKFVTIYPRDESELATTLADLDAELKGQPGPYILSDLRWNDGPLYVRYGGFAERHCRDATTGERMLAIEDPSGTLVPDERGTTFRPPSWVRMPDFIADQAAALHQPRPADFPYEIERALHFSNGGGVYLGTDIRSGRRVVIKEGRPHAGLDGHEADAVTRLRHERDILTSLSGLGVVPEVIGYLTCWEHHFLVEEYIEGEPLNTRYVETYPFIRATPTASSIAAYTDWALAISAELDRCVTAVHSRGIVVGDLHPANVLLRDGHPVLVDLEVAALATESKRRGLAAPGFAAPPWYSGFAADRYALACMKLALFVPLSILFELNTGAPDMLIRAAAKLFPIPTEFASGLRRDLGVAERRSTAAHKALEHPADWVFDTGEDTWDWDSIAASVAAGIHASASPRHPVRLFPGDIAQFNDDALGLASGAAGVLYALHEAGFGVAPAHEEWLIDRAARTDSVRPGLYNGMHGVAYALDRLGHRAEALRALDRLADYGYADEQNTSLFSGLSGVGLNLLHFLRATADPAFGDEALRVTDRIIELIDREAAEPARFAQEATARRPVAGLMHGHCGPALLAIRLHEQTGERRFLDLADQWIRRDLAGCRTADDGSLQVDEGWRVLPYVGAGSAGIGLVLGEFLRHAPDPELSAKLDQIDRAAMVGFTVYPSLFLGGAGLMAYLAHRSACAASGDWRQRRWREHIARHLSRLALYAIPYHGHVAFPGHELRRLSMDVATGSAGVLLALTATIGNKPFPLPFLTTETPAQGDRIATAAALAPARH